MLVFVMLPLFANKQGDANLVWLKSLNKSSLHPFFKNPANPNKKIFFIAVVPHLLKLIRNHFIVSGLILLMGWY